MNQPKRENQMNQQVENSIGGHDSTEPAVIAKPVKKKDIQILDGFDGACQFSDQFELLHNAPTYEFLKWRMGDKMMTEEVRELNEAIDAKDDVEIVDGACDVAFIALTQAYITFRKFGCSHNQALWKVRAAFEEVCRTNLAKNPPSEAGQKITKPDGWKPPRIADLFRHVGQGFMSEAYHRETLQD